MPNAAIAPVMESTKPTLISRPAWAPALTMVVDAPAVLVVAAPVVVVAPALVVVVSSVPPQAASRPPKPAPAPTVAPAMPAIFRNSRRLTLLVPR
jgi:hypothetical protein